MVPKLLGVTPHHAAQDLGFHVPKHAGRLAIHDGRTAWLDLHGRIWARHKLYVQRKSPQVTH